MNVKIKFGIKGDTKVLMLRTFSDSIVIECDWWIHINIRFMRSDNLIGLFFRIRIKLQFSLVGPIANILSQN